MKTKKPKITDLESLKFAQTMVSYQITMAEEKLAQRAELVHHYAKTELADMMSWKSVLYPILPGFVQTLKEKNTDQPALSRFFSNFWNELKQQYQSRLAEWVSLFRAGSV